MVSNSQGNMGQSSSSRYRPSQHQLQAQRWKALYFAVDQVLRYRIIVSFVFLIPRMVVVSMDRVSASALLTP